MTALLPGRALCVAATLVPFTLSPLALAQPAPPTTLDPVVVSASRTPQPRSAVLADVTVIERDEIERAGVTGVADLLARQPGIEAARNGGPGTATSVYIRGGESRHTAVYIDGVRVDSQSTGGAVWEQIPLDQVDRIEVLRGPAAAVYGSDAVAGVVQIFTRRGQGPARPSAALSVGSFGTVQGQAAISGSAGTLDYGLSASHGRSEGFDAKKPGASGHNPDRDGWERSSAQGRVGVQINPVHRVDASLLASSLDSGYDASATSDDRNHHLLRTGTLAWQGRWNATSTTRLQFGQARSSYETRPSFYRTETRLDDLTLMHEQRFGGHVFTGTLERRDDRLFNAGTASGAAFGGRRHQTAVGLGWRGEFGTQGLQLHVRHDEDSEFGGKSTGSLAWGWTFAPAWRATAAAATSFRVPTLYQRFSDYGVADLQPESGRNVELGLRWAAAGSEASLAAWRNRVSHLITFGSPGGCRSSFGCYQSVGRAELTGVTIAGRTMVAGIGLRGSLDWHDPRNVDTDKQLPRRARRLATLGADTVLAGWTLGVDVQAAALRFDNAANTPSQRLGGYGLVNVSLGKALTPGLSLEARIDNLGDKVYEQARNYATAGRSGQVSLRWAL